MICNQATWNESTLDYFSTNSKYLQENYFVWFSCCFNFKESIVKSSRTTADGLKVTEDTFPFIPSSNASSNLKITGVGGVVRFYKTSWELKCLKIIKTLINYLFNEFCVFFWCFYSRDTSVKPWMKNGKKLFGVLNDESGCLRVSPCLELSTFITSIRTTLSNILQDQFPLINHIFLDCL